jgi:4-amino-4-deoxy-L-arabinose transferase-like glycosyltransferase
MLLVTVPWFAVVSERNPGFAEFFFVHEHLSRYATDAAGRVHPWWMFLPVVVLGAMPWVVTAVLALVRPGFGPRSPLRSFDPVRFLWVWCAFTVVFFSCSHSKLIPYVLPAFPALALLAGKRMAETGSTRRDAIVAAVFGLAILAAALAPGLLGLRGVTADEIEACRGFALGASACLVAGGVAAASLPGTSILAAAVLSVSALLACACIRDGFRQLPVSVSSRQVAEAIKSAVPGDAPVYCVEHYDQPLPFYLGRTVDLVHERGELAFGLSEDPRREIPEVALFIRVWQDLAQGAALLPRPLCNSMEENGVPMRRIYEDRRYVAVARR